MLFWTSSPINRSGDRWDTAWSNCLESPDKNRSEAVRLFVTRPTSFLAWLLPQPLYSPANSWPTPSTLYTVARVGSPQRVTPVHISVLQSASRLKDSAHTLSKLCHLKYSVWLVKFSRQSKPENWAKYSLRTTYPCRRVRTKMVTSFVVGETTYTYANLGAGIVAIVILPSSWTFIGHVYLLLLLDWPLPKCSLSNQSWQGSVTWRSNAWS